MNWFDQWFYRKVKYCWENKHEFETSKGSSMKFVWRYLFRKLHQVGSESDQDISIPVAKSNRLMGAVASSDVDWGDGLNIRVHAAHGGKIITFNRYDRKTDRSNSNVYIIPDEQDFERELGKLITLESMRG